MPREFENVRAEARELLLRFLEPAPTERQLELVMALRPAPSDYPRVFHPEVADSIRDAYDASVWKTPPAWRLRPEQTTLTVYAASVEELRDGTGEAPSFPGGYAEAVRLFVDGNVWLCCEYSAKSVRAGMAFDGLVPLDGRFAWFPKPWRALPKARPRIQSHWTE